jgi:hypothetical protein
MATISVSATVQASSPLHDYAVNQPALQRTWPDCNAGVRNVRLDGEHQILYHVKFPFQVALVHSRHGAGFRTAGEDQHGRVILRSLLWHTNNIHTVLLLQMILYVSNALRVAARVSHAMPENDWERSAGAGM